MPPFVYISNLLFLQLPPHSPHLLPYFQKWRSAKLLFQKFPSAEKKVGRVSNGYPEYPIANLHVTETYPPFSLERIFPRDRAFLRLISGSSPHGIALDRAFQFLSARIKHEQADIALVIIPLCPSPHGFIYYWKECGRTLIGIDGKKLDRVSIFSFAKGNGRLNRTQRRGW